MVKITRPLIASIVALTLIGGAMIAGWAYRSTFRAQSASASAAPLPLEFGPGDVVQLALQDTQGTLPFSGTLIAAKQVLVRTPVAGEIRRILVREGGAVREGQVLAEIESADLKGRLSAAQADREERRAKRDLAIKNRDNNQALLNRSFISRNAFDQTNSGVEAAEAAMKYADAQVEMARNALADATVRAPMTGAVARRWVSEGERVSPEATLLTLVDLSQMEIEALIPVDEVPAISLGQTASFSVAGFSGEPFTGKIVRINPVAEPGARTVKVFIAVDPGNQAKQNLRGGMYAEGRIGLDLRRASIQVPRTAIFEEAGQSYLYIIENGLLAKRPVILASRDTGLDRVEIRSGAKVGWTVVRIRMKGLKDGVPAKLPLNPTVAASRG